MVVGGRAPKLRILSVVHRASRMGGAETIAADLALALDAERFESHFCVLRNGSVSLPTRIDELRQQGVAMHEVQSTSMRDIGGFRRFARIVSSPYDIVHAHLWDAYVWSALATGSRYSGALIAHEHGRAFDTARLRKLIDRRFVARRADAFVVVSGSDRRDMADVVGVPPEKIRLIPNSVELAPAGDGARFRAEIGVATEAPLIVVVAVLRPEKRLDVLVEALSILRVRRPTAQVVVAGSGNPRQVEQMQQAIHAWGLGDAVHAVGWRKDVGTILAAADIACLCSEREGMPLALLEYMAAGKPIVATRVGGIPEMVDDGREARLVAPADPGALAAAFDEILADPELAARLGAAAERRYQRDFSFRSYVERVETLYAELAAPRLSV